MRTRRKRKLNGRSRNKMLVKMKNGRRKEEGKKG